MVFKDIQRYTLAVYKDTQSWYPKIYRRRDIQPHFLMYVLMYICILTQDCVAIVIKCVVIIINVWQ